MFYDEHGRLVSILASWTDVDEQDAFAQTAAGRSAFRVEDLRRLRTLIDHLRSEVQVRVSKLRRICKLYNAAMTALILGSVLVYEQQLGRLRGGAKGSWWFPQDQPVSMSAGSPTALANQKRLIALTLQPIGLLRPLPLEVSRYDVMGKKSPARGEAKNEKALLRESQRNHRLFGCNRQEYLCGDLCGHRSAKLIKEWKWSVVMVGGQRRLSLFNRRENRNHSH